MLTLFYFTWISLLVSALLVWTAARARKENFPFTLFLHISGILIISLPLGARIFHVFYEAFDFYAEKPFQIFYVWQGGFVYYGGLLAGAFSTILYFQFLKTERTFLATADFFTPALNLGTGLGRVACYVQGCCFGTQWPFSFPNWERHPTQLYLLFWEILIYFLLDSIKLKMKAWGPGSHFLTWIGLSALGRFFFEYLRVDFRGSFILGLSVSQWVALIILIVAGIFLFNVRFKFLKLKKRT
jgi:phosphatidylglycerol:prolipoprotein diacylglycerol transferase